MKHNLWKRLAALAVCCAVASGTALAANQVAKTVQIYYSSIKLVVNGVPITPKDANGSAAEPFIMNGTTYLPVRAVGEALGQQVGWDGDTKTVYIGEQPNSRKWLMDLCPPYEKSSGFNAATTFQMAGKTYTHGFLMGSGKNYALFNLNGQYSTLSFDLGHKDGSDMHNGRFEIYLDGDLNRVIEIDAEDLVTHFDIPLHGPLQMKIVRNNDFANGKSYNRGSYGFANAELS